MVAEPEWVTAGKAAAVAAIEVLGIDNESF